jgi:hypothetical protein
MFSPLLQHKRYDAPSAFTPESLLREARRQKGIAVAAVPAVCVLDPDGDLVRRLRDDGRTRIDHSWACYHTDLYRTSLDGLELGLIGCAVGAPFAVLVAEELFASGCRLLISITSAGQLVELRPPPYFVLIEKALRDEGASYHYMPASEFSEADPMLLSLLDGRPVSGDQRGDCLDATLRIACSGDGGGSALRIRTRARQSGRMFRSRYQSDGARRAGLRKRRSRRQRRFSGRDPKNGRNPAPIRDYRGNSLADPQPNKWTQRTHKKRPRVANY